MNSSPVPGRAPGRETILVVDSAAGGLGILRRLLAWGGDDQIVYLADTAYHPFGLKPPAQIEAIVASWFAWAARSLAPVRALVIACNTASIAAQATLPSLVQATGIPAVTMLSGMRALAEANVAQIAGRPVGLMGTRLTIEAGVYQPILMRREPRRVIEVVATKTERAVSYGSIFDADGATEARRELEQYVRLVGGPEAIVLGCTCYEFAETPIRAAFGDDVTLLNPADYVAEEVRQLLGATPDRSKQWSAPLLLNSGSMEWERRLRALAGRILGRPTPVHSISLAREPGMHTATGPRHPHPEGGLHEPER